jgi:hypothetical protein
MKETTKTKVENDAASNREVKSRDNPNQNISGSAKRPLTQAETDQAEKDAAYNRKQTGGYDQTKGPDGKSTHTKTVTYDTPDDDIRASFQDVIESWKGKADKEQVAAVLRTTAEMLYRDTSWVRDPATLDYDPNDLDDPRANPMGLRPAPATATRADEHTAPEPDSLGNIADRKAAEAGLNDDSFVSDDENIPPADRDAVAAKRAAQKSVDEFGTAGGSPLARAEHKDDPKPKKK